MEIKKYLIEINKSSVILNYNLDVGKFVLELSLKETKWYY